MPIYTKTGDQGKTSLFGGKRVLKCEDLVDVYGSIDELNSWVGYIVSQLKEVKEKEFLQNIQRDLLLIGSTLAGWKGELVPLTGRIVEMEKRIDGMEKALPQLNNFILPGGSKEAAAVHIARSICRRVERETVAFINKKKTEGGRQKTDNLMIIKYFNRLSDLLYMFARFINKTSNVPEDIWNGKTKI
jgi:cob(I)alamin adenosyltransferase